MSTIIERGRTRNERGKWWPIALGNDSYSATIVCPLCGGRMAITKHSISPDGAVGPSVVCPRSPRVECSHACGWHEVVKLAGWPPTGAP